MNYILNNLQCWWREKVDVKKSPPTTHINTIDESLEVCCSHCFVFLENKDLFIKKAKINSFEFGFCSLDCYLLWLKNPSTMLIGKLN